MYHIDPKLNFDAQFGKYHIRVRGKKVDVYNLQHQSYRGKKHKYEKDGFGFKIHPNGDIIELKFDDNLPMDFIKIMRTKFGSNPEDLENLYGFFVCEIFLTDGTIGVSTHFN